MTVITTRIVNVRYSLLFNRPKRKGIEKACDKLGRKGYRLITRNEHPAGCFKLLFTVFLARGRTELTFTKET